jgi:hypothetical protein
MATTTFYPHNDAYIANDGSTVWSTVRSAATGTAVGNKSSQAYFVYSVKDGGNYQICRSMMLFNTATLPANAIISTAILNIKRAAGSYDNADSGAIHVVTANPSSNDSCTTSDFNITKFGSTSGGSINFSSTSANTYFTISLNATGLTWITKGGMTKLGFMERRDLGNNTPSNNNIITSYFSGTAGTTSDPYLEVTYTVPSSGNPAFFSSGGLTII